jgi:hypothetical protein
MEKSSYLRQQIKEQPDGRESAETRFHAPIQIRQKPGLASLTNNHPVRP